MVMKKLVPKVSEEDKENARLDRDRSKNPADVEPGMDDWNWGDSSFSSGNSDGWGSSFGTPGGFGGDSGLGNSGLGGGFGGGLGSGFGNQPFGSTMEPKKEDIEDKFWDVVKKFFSGFMNFSSELVKSFKSFDVVTRMNTGRTIIFVSGGVIFTGFILSLFGLWKMFGVDFVIAGLTSAGVGVMLFMVSYDEFSKNKDKILPTSSPSSGAFDSSFDSPFSDFSSESFGSDEDDNDGFIMDDGDEEDDFGFSFDSNEEEDFGGFDQVEITDPEEIKNNMETTLSVVNIDKGMVTRQYLYETITSCLANINKNFDKVRVIPEGSDEFDSWDAIVQKSANQFKPKGSEVEMPYLLEAKERLFYLLLSIKRVSWLKNIDAFVQEIVNICAFDEDTGKMDESIYGVGSVVGDRIYVKIMKGETAMVSVKDTYKNIEEEIKNPKNYMPIVIGLDAEGGVVWRDFKDINSLLVTGMPRSGKTWLVLSILGQMMFFLKPSELQFYILDPKEAISDFSNLETPHIRKFVSSDKEILAELRNVVKVEGPRRKKIIGDAGCKNIWDFKKRYPDVEMPLLYVVIDEVITLAERMEKEVKDEFQGLILELVSQLPAVGIRIFMIPHVVKDQVLKKSITDLIPCRISVRGDAEHIEKSVGAKNFKHRLLHQGDMAVRFNNDEPMFVHSAVLTPSNDANIEFFDFLRRFWSKIEPESVKGSLYEKRYVLGGIQSNTRSNIEMVVEETPYVAKSIASTPKLDKSDVEELLRMAHEDDSFDLWDKE